MGTQSPHIHETRARRRSAAPGRPSAEDLRAAISADPDDLKARLDLAEYYLRANAKERINGAFDGCAIPDRFDNAETESRYYRLCALGHVSRRKLIEAEEAAQNARRVDPASLDALFVQAFVHVSLREFDQAASSAGRFVEEFRSVQQSRIRIDQYTCDYEHLSQILNMRGSASLERGAFEEAQRSFEQAIKADPTALPAYLNLWRLYRRANQPEEARSIVERGLRECAETEELRMCAALPAAATTVSACMIVKDEEELLPGCLDSIGHWVDEIIVVDTGSTDRTVEIAKSYGARVFHQPWEGDFSRHRNFALAQATSNWILVIDADERFEASDVAAARNWMNRPEAKALEVRVRNTGERNGVDTTVAPSVRLFRRETGFRYEGAVHNQLLADPSTTVHRIPVTIRHLGYNLTPERRQAKADRTIELLEKQLAENPDDALAHFNYAQTLLALGTKAHPENAKRILKAAERAVELTDPGVPGQGHIHLMALYQAALGRYMMADYDGAEEHAHDALKQKPDYLDQMLLLGHISMKRGETARAERCYREYLRYQERFDETGCEDAIIVCHAHSRHIAWYALGYIAETRQAWAEALEQYERVVGVAPDYGEVWARLGYVHLGAGDPDNAEKMFVRQIEIRSDSLSAEVGRALVLYERGKGVEADELIRIALDNCSCVSEQLLALAGTLEDFGRTEEACRFLDKACTLAMTGGDRRAAADLYFELGRHEQAAELYRSLLKDVTPDSGLMNRLGECVFRMQDFIRAEEWFARAVAQPFAPAAAWRNLGMARLQLNDPQGALAALERYEPAAPDEPEIAQLIGDLHARLGCDDRAIAYYERCLAANRTDRLALFGLSECFQRQGRTDEALAGYRKVLALDPDFEPAQRRLCELSERVGA